MTAAGLIFANTHDNSIPEMTRLRTMASVPFGGRYRLIDFALSNMVNSDITKVGVITHYNYQSLLDHIGNGKDWDLARRSGGIKILPPYITMFDSSTPGVNRSRMDALKGAVNFINRCSEDYIVMSDCDVICNIDLKAVLEAHEKSGADLTFVTKVVDAGSMYVEGTMPVVRVDENGRVTDFAEEHLEQGNVTISTNIMVATRTYLQNVVQEAASHGYTSFFKDIIAKSLDRANYRAYEYDGVFAKIGSMEGYFACSMALLDEDTRKGIWGVPNRPILTKVRNSAPTKYCGDAKIVNSVVADGCVVEGTVENSILFRGVKVGKGTVVKNSILMQDTYTGENVLLNCVITDKNVMIKDGRMLSGCESMPFYIGKNGAI
jgi:glucose-1-phosphate adenylyltransferase